MAKSKFVLTAQQEQLLVQHYDLVERAARRTAIKCPWINQDDIHSYLNIEAVKIASYYDPAKNSNFPAYFYSYLKQRAMSLVNNDANTNEKKTFSCLSKEDSEGHRTSFEVQDTFDLADEVAIKTTASSLIEELLHTATPFQREMVQAMMKDPERLTANNIAKTMGSHPTKVSRELAKMAKNNQAIFSQLVAL